MPRGKKATATSPEPGTRAALLYRLAFPGKGTKDITDGLFKDIQRDAYTQSSGAWSLEVLGGGFAYSQRLPDRKYATYSCHFFLQRDGTGLLTLDAVRGMKNGEELDALQEFRAKDASITLTSYAMGATIFQKLRRPPQAEDTPPHQLLFERAEETIRAGKPEGLLPLELSLEAKLTGGAVIIALEAYRGKGFIVRMNSDYFSDTRR
jgi:hypothetical protein